MSAWKDIDVNNENSELVYASVCDSYANGTLFRHNKRGIIPEQLPEDWEGDYYWLVDDDIVDDVEDDVLLHHDFVVRRGSIMGNKNRVEASEKEDDKDVEVKEKKVRKKNNDKNVNKKTTSH